MKSKTNVNAKQSISMRSKIKHGLESTQRRLSDGSQSQLMNLKNYVDESTTMKKVSGNRVDVRHNRAVESQLNDGMKSRRSLFDVMLKRSSTKTTTTKRTAHNHHHGVGEKRLKSTVKRTSDKTRVKVRSMTTTKASQRKSKEKKTTYSKAASKSLNSKGRVDALKNEKMNRKSSHQRGVSLSSPQPAHNVKQFKLQKNSINDALYASNGSIVKREMSANRTSAHTNAPLIPLKNNSSMGVVINDSMDVAKSIGSVMKSQTTTKGNDVRIIATNNNKNDNAPRDNGSKSPIKDTKSTIALQSTAHVKENENQKQVESIKAKQEMNVKSKQLLSTKRNLNSLDTKINAKSLAKKKSMKHSKKSMINKNNRERVKPNKLIRYSSSHAHTTIMNNEDVSTRIDMSHVGAGRHVIHRRSHYKQNDSSKSPCLILILTMIVLVALVYVLVTYFNFDVGPQ